MDLETVLNNERIGFDYEPSLECGKKRMPPRLLAGATGRMELSFPEINTMEEQI